MPYRDDDPPPQRVRPGGDLANVAIGGNTAAMRVAIGVTAPARGAIGKGLKRDTMLAFLVQSGFPVRYVAAGFGLSESTVRSSVNRTAWKFR